MTTHPELNTDNPEYYTWQYEQMQIAILGGVKEAEDLQDALSKHHPFG